MTQLFSANVDVYYGQAYLELAGPFDGFMENCFHGQQNGICGAAAPQALFLITGLHTGPVGMEIHCFDDDPGIDDSWDEIVEVSFLAPRTEIVLVEWAAPRQALPLTSGAYRARYYARDMDAGRELDTNTTSSAVDTYRIDLWRAGRAADRIIKRTSECAAYWHDWAAGLTDRGRA